VFRVRKDAARTAAAGATRPASPSDASDLPKIPTTFEELRVLHQRTTREWHAEVQRLSRELHAITVDLHAAQRTLANVERSLFWKVRRGWVRLAGFFGSQRGDTRREW
jgi:hypothetical protein